jgi:hypothetical protein
MSSTLNEVPGEKIYDKYQVSDATSAALGEGRTESTGREYGQEKFGVRGRYTNSANCDESRFTENDRIAHDRLTNGREAQNDDSQGGKY